MSSLKRTSISASVVPLLLSFAVMSPTLLAQQSTGRALTIDEAVRRALDRYPSVRVSSATLNAAAAGIRIARTAYLPKLDAIAGVNRATRNNVFGLLFPSQIIAPISGPVLGTNDLDSAWGSTVGLLVSWQPFDFDFVEQTSSSPKQQRAVPKQPLQELSLRWPASLQIHVSPLSPLSRP